MRKVRQQMNWFYVPALLLMILFVIWPFVQAFQISLMRWNGYGKVRTFIGAKNYLDMLKDPTFFKAFLNTVIYGVGCTLLQNVIGLAVAMLVNSRFRGNNMVRAIVYMPIMISSFIMGYIMYFFFSFNRGIVNELISYLGMEPADWLANKQYAVIIILLVNSWQYVGNSMIMYLAGLQGISSTYIEAATVDGATSGQVFTRIILPLLIPSIQTSVITNLIGSLKLYDIIMSLTSGGPGHGSESLATYISNRYFDAEKAGYAAAIGIFTFIFIMAVSNSLNYYFDRKGVEY